MESSTKPRLRGQVRNVIEAIRFIWCSWPTFRAEKRERREGEGLLVIIPAGPERCLLNGPYMLTVVTYHLVQ